MSKEAAAVKVRKPFPLLTYHCGWLIVDKAWVDARRKMMLVKIRDRYFEIELDDAKAGPGPWPKLDQCDLMPVDHGPTETDWPLGREGTELPFRFMLRSRVSGKEVSCHG